MSTNTYKPAAVPASQWPQRLEQLCAIRDAVNAANAAAEVELTKVNAEIEVLRLRAVDIAASIDARRGGMQWIELKKEIGLLSKALSGKR